MEGCEDWVRYERVSHLEGGMVVHTVAPRAVESVTTVYGFAGGHLRFRRAHPWGGGVTREQVWSHLSQMHEGVCWCVAGPWVWPAAA